jgi:dsRNA-specific ribonuclease
MLATIILPNSVDPSVRKATSAQRWKTEKMAKRDAAFEAYVALHKAGLVNDNLLPLIPHQMEELGEGFVEKKPSLVDCLEQINPWIDVAKAWNGDATHNSAVINITPIDQAEESMDLILTLPTDWPNPRDFLVYWKGEDVLRISYQKPQTSLVTVQDHRSVHLALLRLALRRKVQLDQSDFVALVTIPSGQQILNTSLDIEREVRPALDFYLSGTLAHEMGLVYDTLMEDTPYVPLRWLACEMEVGEGSTEKKVETCIEAVRFGKRADFLHPLANQATQKAPTILVAQHCTVDRLPYRYARAASFIPCILHRVSTQLLATHLSKTLLASLQISDTNLILTAITAPQAREGYDYQSVEFLGDSVLKFLTTAHLYSSRPTWHEGYLSAKKDRIVSNENLCKAALHAGLDAFIITKIFTGHKWKPQYISELLIPKQQQMRRLSSKILADVVEALIGSSYLFSGLSCALSALKIFLPSDPWPSTIDITAHNHQELTLPAYLQPLEGLTGHTFQHPHLLIEALTHPSQQTSGLSYQRLEFLGDSILDFLVVRRIFASSHSIPPGKMHLMKIAVVSADILAFLSMETFVSQTRHEILPEDSQSTDPSTPLKIHAHEDSKALWTFMRHASSAITAAQLESLKRHELFRSSIWAALRTGTIYPWTTFARVSPDKFFSDLVESILGALFVDSGGDLDLCESFLATLGLMDFLDRVVRGEMLIMPPKNRLGIWAAKRERKVRYEVGVGPSPSPSLGPGPGTPTPSTTTAKKEEPNLPKTEKQHWWCKALVAEEVICEIRDGRAREEVVTRAAEMAVDILEEKEKQEKETEGIGKGRAGGGERRKRDDEGDD